jgi:hypothetical protein
LSARLKFAKKKRAEMSRVLVSPALKNSAWSKCNCLIAIMLRFSDMSWRIYFLFFRILSFEESSYLVGFVQFLSLGTSCWINNSNINSCLCPLNQRLEWQQLDWANPSRIWKLLRFTVIIFVWQSTRWNNSNFIKYQPGCGYW